MYYEIQQEKKGYLIGQIVFFKCNDRNNEAFKSCFLINFKFFFLTKPAAEKIQPTSTSVREVVNKYCYSKSKTPLISKTGISFLILI